MSFRVFHSLQQAYRNLFGAADSIIKSHEGIVTAHQVILMVLRQNDGLKASEIADRAGLSRSRLTGLLDTLETKNIVRREADKNDGRVQRIFLEPEGHAIIERTKEWVGKLNEDLLAPFSDEERDTIERFLKHVRATAKSMGD